MWRHRFAAPRARIEIEPLTDCAPVPRYQAPNGASSGAKVLPSNLDRALKLAMLPPRWATPTPTPDPDPDPDPDPNPNPHPNPTVAQARLAEGLPEEGGSAQVVQGALERIDKAAKAWW